MTKEIWCVVEVSNEGDIFDPELFSTREKALEFIKDDSGDCLALYPDYPDMKRVVDERLMKAAVSNEKMGWKWEAFSMTVNFK